MFRFFYFFRICLFTVPSPYLFIFYCYAIIIFFFLLCPYFCSCKRFTIALLFVVEIRKTQFILVKMVCSSKRKNRRRLNDFLLIANCKMVLDLIKSLGLSTRSDGLNRAESLFIAEIGVGWVGTLGKRTEELKHVFQIKIKKISNASKINQLPYRWFH